MAACSAGALTRAAADDVAETTGVDTAVPGTVGGGEEASIFISNLDHSATPEDLQAHFRSCGTVNRITILCNKFTGKPKGASFAAADVRLTCGRVCRPRLRRVR